VSPHPALPRNRGRERVAALVFDFDGVIVDTEGPIFRVWQRIYRERGQELPRDQWLTIIGTSTGPFDPVLDLGRRTGEALDRDELDALERRYYREATSTQQLLPGVEGYLAEARRLRLKTAVASSSRSAWVLDHLARFGIHEHFDAILCREDVSRTKPDPELYQKALERLSVSAAQALAFEDSTNGLRAAKAAGLYCVAVPNPLTVDLDFSGADLRLESLESMPLPALLERVELAESR
jgi:HAD superfamily hydrolase (TIGR01509 family)